MGTERKVLSRLPFFPQIFPHISGASRKYALRRKTRLPATFGPAGECRRGLWRFIRH
ncbi:hypothetical protein HMPREF1326_00315 [Akkermansia sp. KLE1605]|nr:hypothetical protein HMPREF1326_00315 [Akkermansia sp. KLE1605]